MSDFLFLIALGGIVTTAAGGILVGLFVTSGKSFSQIERSHLDGLFGASFSSLLVACAALLFRHLFDDPVLFWKLLSGLWAVLLVIILALRWLEALRIRLRPPLIVSVMVFVGLALSVPNAFVFGTEHLFATAIGIHFAYALISLTLLVYELLGAREA